MNDQPTITVDQALAVLRKDYWDEVFSAAENLRGEIECGDLTDRDDLEQRIDELADSHQYVIYTHLALQTIMFTEHDDDITDVYGNDAPILQGGSVNYSLLAYYGFRGDVREQCEVAGVFDLLDKAPCRECRESYPIDDLYEGLCDACYGEQEDACDECGAPRCACEDLACPHHQLSCSLHEDDDSE